MVDVITPSSPAYELYRHVYTARGNPGHVYVPKNAEEVSAALGMTLAGHRELSIRSGGHGISSVSTNEDGIVIDLRRLDRVERLDDTRVRIGPGARWGSIAHQLEPWGLAISSGDSGDVGVGGLATTGGIGLMGRAHGLTIDRLRAAEIVTADGSIHRVDDAHDPDLFWAIRGAGANVGIVTSFEFDASVASKVVQGTLFFGIPDVAHFLHLWGEILESSPREISAFLYIAAGPVAQAQATIVYADSDEEAAREAMKDFLALPGLVQQQIAVVPYSSVPITTGDPHAGQQGAHTHSGLLDHLDTTTSRVLAEHLADAAVDMIMVRSVGGAINDVEEMATAYAHRHQNFSIMSVSMIGGEPFDRAWKPAYQLMDGMYLSFETAHKPGHIEDAFPPKTLERLRSIKAERDPENIFHQNFGVALR